MSSSQVTGLLRACHPAPCVAVTAFTAALAWTAGRGAGTVWVGLAVLSGHVSVGWSNDWLDAERDRVAGRHDKPVATGVLSATSVRAAALTGLALCAPLSLLAGGPRAAALHLAAVAIAWAYNLGLKATVASPLPYAASFALLPVFVAATVDGTAPAWTVAATALLGAGAHFTNALPDLADDRATGVRGLPQRLGPRASAVVAAALLLAGTAVVALALPASPTALAATVAAAVLLTGAAAWGLRQDPRAARAPFTLTILGAACLVVALVASGGVLA